MVLREPLQDRYLYRPPIVARPAGNPCNHETSELRQGAHDTSSPSLDSRPPLGNQTLDALYVNSRGWRFLLGRKNETSGIWFKRNKILCGKRAVRTYANSSSSPTSKITARKHDQPWTTDRATVNSKYHWENKRKAERSWGCCMHSGKKCVDIGSVQRRRHLLYVASLVADLFSSLHVRFFPRSFRQIRKRSREGLHWRQKCCLLCLDDWKLNSAWDKISNDNLADTVHENQGISAIGPQAGPTVLGSTP
jgi:hypothetical protein